ncbi:MAG: GldG family protein [Candidatus Nitrotoga sp.]
MKLPQPNLLIKNLAFTALLLAALVSLYQFAARHPLKWDATQNTGNSLADSSVNILKQLQGEIKLTMYVTGQDANLGDMHRLTRDFVALYQRYKPDISLTFVDPVKQPEVARKVNIKVNGEMLVEYGGKREHLTMLNEQALTSVLLRMAHTKNQLLMYLDGHGERNLEGIANHDLGEFGKRLQQNGFHLNSLNLTLAQEVPNNASMLIITQPQIDLLQGEIDKLLHYIDNGGNLLWLVDAEPLHGLERLTEKLDIILTPGIVIDPIAAEEMNIPATWALGAGYPPHAITLNFNLTTVFPFARAIDWEENTVWKRTMLVEAAPRGWVSRDISQGKPHFNKTLDVPGPVTIALALQRNINDREQRIVIVGSGSFLANAYSGNGGNLDLGVNMTNWLGNEEVLITTQPRAVKDGAITLSKTYLTMISGSFLIAVPLLLMLAGALQWWRRRN